MVQNPYPFHHRAAPCHHSGPHPPHSSVRTKHHHTTPPLLPSVLSLTSHIHPTHVRHKTHATRHEARGAAPPGSEPPRVTPYVAPWMRRDLRVGTDGVVLVASSDRARAVWWTRLGLEELDRELPTDSGG